MKGLKITIGKRKTAIARAKVMSGKGKIIVNNQDIEEYIPNETMRLKAIEPLMLTGNEGKYDVTLTVYGGGSSSQVDAIRQAIARSLLESKGSDDMRKLFLEYDRSLLVSDTRFKETKKPNNSHARAKRQKSYR